MDNKQNKPVSKFDGLNMYSVNGLLTMGYEEDQIVSVLTYLKKQANYSPIGEIDRAIDHIEREKQYK